ncbi:MAG: sel1 repeat family protein [Caulobacterales bacterium]|nr:sel1 repeat family protein [Caulobacterales bacterium]
MLQPCAVLRVALAAAVVLCASPLVARAQDRPQIVAPATDPQAQADLADAYFYGRGQPQSYKEARRWFDKAAAQGHPQATRRLGEMYADGLGGKKSKTKARELWIAAEKAGDPQAAILVADSLYQEITGKRTPEPGKFKFEGGVPLASVDDAIAWYEAAEAHDPRPASQTRAKAALHVLKTLKSAASAAPKGR